MALAPIALEFGAAFTPVHFQERFLQLSHAGKTLRMQLGNSDWQMSCSAQAELSAGISWRALRILQQLLAPLRGAPGWELSPAVGFSIPPASLRLCCCCRQPSRGLPRAGTGTDQTTEVLLKPMLTDVIRVIEWLFLHHACFFCEFKFRDIKNVSGLYYFMSNEFQEQNLET